MSFYFLNLAENTTLSKHDIPLVFMPGWGFDARIIILFGFLKNQHLIVPQGFISAGNIGSDLLTFLDQHAIGRVKIVGWSMGANIGLDFACRNEERVASLELLSMRRQWPQKDVDDIRQGVRADLSGFMASFYRKCFLGYRKEYSTFVDHLQDAYLQELDIDTLLSGLDYLQNFSLPKVPDGVDVHCIHGAKDVIAPIEERAVLPGMKETLFPTAGHGVLFDYERLSQSSQRHREDTV